MAQVSVNLAADVQVGQNIAPSKQVRMSLIPEGGSSGLNVPYAPREIDYSDISASWDVIKRTGRMPLIVRADDPQPRMQFTLNFVDPDPSVSMAADIRTLAQYARLNTRLSVKYSSWENGLWRITSMSVHSVMRHEVTDEITQADVDVELVLASDVSTHLGPVSGGVTTPPGSGLQSIGGTSGGIQKYTVKKGDTLHSIAIKFYHNARKWRAIADANKIKNPRDSKKLKPGRVLRIPK